MKWSLTDTMWEVTSLLLREIALLTVGRLLFFTFGFESERPWQFVLFMMAFLLLNISLNFFGKKILGWVQQNMGIREEQHLAFLDAMYEFLIGLMQILLLRNLPGIHIKALAAYDFAVFRGGSELLVKTWKQWHQKSRE